MNTIIGYLVSGLGLATLALSADKIKNNIGIEFLTKIPSNYIMAIGTIFLVGGIIILMSTNKDNSAVKQAKEEVPIYEGEGKHRKIVGYRKG